VEHGGFYEEVTEKFNFKDLEYIISVKQIYLL